MSDDKEAKQILNDETGGFAEPSPEPDGSANPKEKDDKPKPEGDPFHGVHPRAFLGTVGGKMRMLLGRESDPEAVAKATANPGHWQGNTYVRDRVEPWQSTLFNRHSRTEGPTNADLAELLRAYKSGEMFSDGIDAKGAIENYVAKFGVTNYEILLRELKTKSETKNYVRFDSGPKTEGKTDFERLDNFYKNLGFSDIKLNCGHLLNSKTSPQIERILVDRAPQAFCVVCAQATPRKVIVDQLEKMLEKGNEKK
jgi:hypothetical protein